MKAKIAFDLKFCKLQHSNWNREDLRELSQQLMQRQGDARFSIENRIIIAFDKSKTSSTQFLKNNERIMLQKIIEMTKQPQKYWHKVTINNKEISICVILIKEGEYTTSNEVYEHKIGDGLREEKKADFAHKFLEHMNWVTDGIVEAHSNPKEHGIDGYIYLPNGRVHVYPTKEEQP